jgi:DNA invertase Pin-like site-specific DNA recombinase
MANEAAIRELRSVMETHGLTLDDVLLVTQQQKRAAKKNRIKDFPRSGRAWGYIRVSTYHQKKSGLSVEDQRQEIERYCRERGLELAGIFQDEAVSSRIPFTLRPGGSALQSSLKEGDTIIVKNHARAFRNTVDACTRAERWCEIDHCYLVILDMGGQQVDYATSLGRFIFSIMAAVTQYEREATAERTAEVLMYRRQKEGVASWQHCSLGERWLAKNNTVIVKIKCEDTWETMRFIHTLVREHGLSLRQAMTATRRRPRLLTKRRRDMKLPSGKWTFRVSKCRVDWNFRDVKKAVELVDQEILLAAAAAQPPQEGEVSA